MFLKAFSFSFPKQNLNFSLNCWERINELKFVKCINNTIKYIFYRNKKTCNVQRKKLWILLIQKKYGLHFFVWFEPKRSSVWCQINRKSVITIQIWYALNKYDTLILHFPVLFQTDMKILNMRAWTLAHLLIFIYINCTKFMTRWKALIFF